MYLEPGLFVTIEQLNTDLAPAPKPLQHGFSKGVAYRALGAFSLSESGEAYFILSNDEDEIWFISNRHLRTYRLMPERHEFRVDLGERMVSRNGANGQRAPKRRRSTRRNGAVA